MGCGEAKLLTPSRAETSVAREGVAAQGDKRPWRASVESLPSAIRSGGAGRVATDADDVGGAALLPAGAASAAGIFQGQPMAVSGCVDRGWTRAPLQRVFRRMGSGHHCKGVPGVQDAQERNSVHCSSGTVFAFVLQAMNICFNTIHAPVFECTHHPLGGVR